MTLIMGERLSFGSHFEDAVPHGRDAIRCLFELVGHIASIVMNQKTMIPSVQLVFFLFSSRPRPMEW